MAGAHCIAIEVQESRIEKRLETRYLDRRATSIDEALEIIRSRERADQRRPARQRRRDPAGDAEARDPPRRAHRPDQRARSGQRLLPGGLERRQVAGDARARSRGGRRGGASSRSRSHVEAMLAFKEMGVPTFDYGNNIRQEAKDRASRTRSTSPGSFPPTSARCSAAASVRSAGPRFAATPRTSTAPTRG